MGLSQNGYGCEVCQQWHQVRTDGVELTALVQEELPPQAEARTETRRRQRDMYGADERGSLHVFVFLAVGEVFISIALLKACALAVGVQCSTS